MSVSMQQNNNNDDLPLSMMTGAMTVAVAELILFSNNMFENGNGK